MKDVSRSVSLGLFVLVLLCFMLPFARITCRGGNGKQEVVVQATGYEVAFGKRIPARPDPTSRAEARPAETIGPDFAAIATLVAVLVGIGLVGVKGRRGAVIRAIHSGHCLLLPLALLAELQLRAGLRANVQMLFGWWATLGSFVAACIFNLVAIPFLPRASPPPAETCSGSAAGQT